MDSLIAAGETFAFETTLASRTFPGRLEHATNKGYKIVLLFFWLQSPDLAVERVRQRVSEGGHAIPADTILRRYKRGLINLFEVYLSLSHLTYLFDNSAGKPELIARKVGNDEWSKQNELTYDKLFSAYEHAKEN
jgi:predicted ABC-type ATPase